MVIGCFNTLKTELHLYEHTQGEMKLVPLENVALHIRIILY